MALIMAISISLSVAFSFGTRYGEPNFFRGGFLAQVPALASAFYYPG
jgi:hypothetical protein